MKFIKLDLLTLLISLFLFASCENTSTIGLEVDPSIALTGSLVDTATITSRTLTDDVTATYALARHPLGFLQDPIFGLTQSDLAMSVNLPSASTYSFGTNAVLDSAVLVLNFGGEFYGDSTSNYTVDVHQLTNNLATELSFLQNKTFPYNSTLLGTRSGRLFPNTKYKVTSIVAGAADTLKTVTPQIRIKLDKTFITNNILSLNETSLKYNERFTNAFKGLLVKIRDNSSTGVGGMMFFDFTGSASNLELYYKKQNATTTTNIDTVAVNFPITTSYGPVAASIKHNYTGTPIATQLAAPNQQFPVTYLQPMSGLRNKIAFPYLKNFANSVGKIVVNKAELVIEVAAGSDPIPFNAAPRLSLYRYDIAGVRKNVPDGDNGTDQSSAGDKRALAPTVFGGYYDAINRRYVFVVTSYVQDLLDGKTTDYGTFLAPTPSGAYELYPSMATAARSVIGSFKKNPAAGDNLMKLNIYYTKIN